MKTEFTLYEASKHYGVPVHVLSLAVTQGRLPAKLYERETAHKAKQPRWFIQKADLDDFLDGKDQRPSKWINPGAPRVVKARNVEEGKVRKKLEEIKEARRLKAELDWL